MIVLVADDLDVNRKLLRTLLAAEGYDVIEASNGTDAFKILQGATGPIVGLIDWEMPEMEGIEVCRQARALEDDAAALSDPPHRPRQQAGHRRRACKAGANDYITKPFDKTELLARVGIGKQMVQLQQALTERVAELKEALHLRQATRRPAAHLQLLQKNPRRPKLLAAGGVLRRQAFRGQVQPFHLPAMLRGHHQAPDGPARRRSRRRTAFPHGAGSLIIRAEAITLRRSEFQIDSPESNR